MLAVEAGVGDEDAAIDLHYDDKEDAVPGWKDITSLASLKDCVKYWCKKGACAAAASATSHARYSSLIACLVTWGDERPDT